MGATVRKWRAVFTIFLQETLVYRAQAVIWILTDLVVSITMPLVWASASAARTGTIAGFTTSDFVLYYLCLLLLGCFITSHIMWELAMEIKEGQFSATLIRPMSFFQFTFFRNLTWRIVRFALCIPIFGVLLFIYRGYLSEAQVYLGWEFWVSVVLGHLVSFTVVYMLAMLALFFQETQSIFELYYVPMLFLSGQLFPVAVLPAWAQGLAKVFPFYFTTGAPTEILIGRLSGPDAVQAIAIQVAWIVAAYGMGRVMWRFGLRYYTGVGM